jgi:hypothetical protein
MPYGHSERRIMQTDVEKEDIRFPEPPENLRGHR